MKQLPRMYLFSQCEIDNSLLSWKFREGSKTKTSWLNSIEFLDHSFILSQLKSKAQSPIQTGWSYSISNRCSSLDFDKSVMEEYSIMMAGETTTKKAWLSELAVRTWQLDSILNTMPLMDFADFNKAHSKRLSSWTWACITLLYELSAQMLPSKRHSVEVENSLESLHIDVFLLMFASHKNWNFLHESHFSKP